MKNKLSGAVTRHRYALFFFAHIVLYHIIIVNQFQPWKVTEITYSYHIVDYKTLGFRPLLLPGSLFYGLFGEHATRTAATVYETVLILLFFLGLSFLLERFFLQVEQRFRPAAIILLIFYLSGPFTFSIFTDELGMLDVYYLFFSFFFFIFLENKFLRLLIPVIFILSLLTHFSVLISYMLLFSIVLLYRISIDPNRRNKFFYALVFAASLLFTAGLFLFLLLHIAENNLMTQEDFHRLFESRGSHFTDYYDYAIYNTYESYYVVSSDTLSISSPIWKAINTIADKVSFTFRAMYFQTPAIFLIRIVFAASMLSPPLCFFYKWIFGFLKTIRDNKLKRFSVFLMMIQFPITAVVSCLFSSDIIRWFTHAFLITFTSFIFVLHHEDDLRTRVLSKIAEIKSSLPMGIFFLAWFFSNIWAYC